MLCTKQHNQRLGVWFALRPCDMIAFVHAGAEWADRRSAGLAVVDGGGGTAASRM